MAIMKIIIFIVKSFLKIHFCGIQLTVFRKLTSFYEKSRIACNHFDARKHSLRDLFSTDQENGSE